LSTFTDSCAEPAKFQLKAAGHNRVCGEYEGDSMQQDGEYVKIMKFTQGGTGPEEQVAAIRLDKGYAVVKVEEK